MSDSRRCETVESGRGDLTVLCIDDDADILTIVRLALELDGDIHVDLASSAEQALLALVATTYKPDCILLDVELPGSDGKLLLREIRDLARHRTTPVIFLTAHVPAMDQANYSALGAVGMIAKPFDPLKLAAEVRTLARGSS